MIKLISKSIIILLIILFFVSCKDNRTDYQKANDFFKEKKYDKAILYFRSSIKDGGDKSILYKKLANSYIKINQFTQAKEALSKAVKLTPDDDDLMYLYIEIMHKKKEYTNVLFRLKSMSDTYRKNILLSQVYLELRKTKDSFAYLDKAIKYIDDDNEKLKLRYDFAKKVLSYDKKCIEKNKLFSNIYDKMKENTLFLEDYYKALACTYPDKVQDRQVIRLYNSDKEKRDLIRLNILTKLIKTIDNKYYYNELAQIYIDKRKFRKARNMIRASKDLDKNQDILLYLMAQIDHKIGRNEFALEQLRTFMTRNKDIKVLRLVAKIEYILENNFSAIKHYKEIVKRDQYDKNSLYKLEELYQRVGDKDAETKIKYKIKFFYRKFYR